MRLAAAFLLLALPVQAETLSQEIARTGLAATQSRLLTQSSPSDADRFALGGVSFLRAIEGTFQDRYAMGLTDRMGLLPLLRLPLQDNPAPAPFQPAAITTLFTHAAEGLTQAQAALTAIPATSDVALTIALDDLWFDVDSSGTRSAGEGLVEIVGSMGAAPAGVTVRFDAADAAWLAAYADLLAGICDVVRAYDPTEPISRILAARQSMQAMGALIPDPVFGGGSGGVDVVDLIAMVLASLNQQPDRALMAEAQGHLLAMVAQNREFWARVAKETDNDHEWLPNDAQTSALGIEVPKGTGAAWLEVLADMEAALKGDKLIPYWRVDGAVGVNLNKVFADPRPVDLAGWVQGWAAVPYLEKGPLVSTDKLNAFDMLVNGQAPLFAIYLN
jgi:hypothetical protein